MTPAGELRLRLFNAYATQLTSMGRVYHDFPKVEDTFLCPFCQQTFGRDALDAPPRLTVEHCIPKSLGGTKATATLICAACNNSMGATIDANLARQYEAQEFMAGRSDKTRRAWVELGEGRARADLKFSGGDKSRMSVYFDRDNSHQGQFDAAIRAIDDGVTSPEGFKWKFAIDMRYNPRKSVAALLRIGFLMMFRQFGYTYILHDNLRRVREQILNPSQEIITKPVAINLPTVPLRVNEIGIISSSTAQL